MRLGARRLRFLKFELGCFLLCAKKRLMRIGPGIRNDDTYAHTHGHRDGGFRSTGHSGAARINIAYCHLYQFCMSVFTNNDSIIIMTIKNRHPSRMSSGSGSGSGARSDFPALDPGNATEAGVFIFI